MKRIFKTKFFLLIFLTLCLLKALPLEAMIYDNNQIRVGLTKEYFNKPFIEITDNIVSIGFSKDNVFSVTNTIKSRTGIRVSKGFAEKAYDEEFHTFVSAKNKANLLSDSADLILPVLIGTEKDSGIWQLYRVYENKEEKESSKYLLDIKAGKNRFLVDAEKVGSNPQFESNNIISLKKGSYRGRIEIGTYGRDGVTPVNIVDIEDYVRGVVPMEMNYTWNEEALKAQAVCARSFGAAVSGFGSDGDIEKGYTLTNTSSHQSYGGINVEKEETDEAIRATANEFVTYENRVVKTPYFSTSGGYTESSENVWKDKRPWLKAVPDEYENKPEKTPWEVGFTGDEVLSRVRRYKDIGKVQKIKIIKTSRSGRVLKLRIYGSKGKITLKKNEIRSTFSLYSTMFKVYTENSENTELKDKDFVFKGRGYGHGVGFSQSGARGMADEGFDYKEILEHYFTDIEVN